MKMNTKPVPVPSKRCKVIRGSSYYLYENPEYHQACFRFVALRLSHKNHVGFRVVMR